MIHHVQKHSFVLFLFFLLGGGTPDPCVVFEVSKQVKLGVNMGTLGAMCSRSTWQLGRADWMAAEGVGWAPGWASAGNSAFDAALCYLSLTNGGEFGSSESTKLVQQNDK